MTIRILPQEFLFQENLNPIQVQTTVSKDLLDDPKMFLPHLRHFNLAAGTIILVQVMNDAKDMLLHEADFRVIAAVESMHGVEDDYGSRVKTQTQYQIQRWSEWRSSDLAPMEDEPVPVEFPEIYVPSEATIQHTGGRNGAWKVICGEKVWAIVERMADETKEEHKERAKGIAAGSFMKPLQEEAA